VRLGRVLCMDSSKTSTSKLLASVCQSSFCPVVNRRFIFLSLHNTKFRLVESSACKSIVDFKNNFENFTLYSGIIEKNLTMGGGDSEKSLLQCYKRIIWFSVVYLFILTI